MEKSTNYNGTDAIEMINASDNADEIRAFIEEDGRKTVQVAAEKRIAAVTVQEKATPEEMTATAYAEQYKGGPPMDKKPSENEKDAPPVIAERNTWVYHKDFEPKIIKKDEVIPEGWALSAKGIVGKFWQIDGFGKWTRIGGAS